jgi:hypothetical protein
MQNRREHALNKGLVVKGVKFVLGLMVSYVLPKFLGYDLWSSSLETQINLKFPSQPATSSFAVKTVISKEAILTDAAIYATYIQEYYEYLNGIYLDKPCPVKGIPGYQNDCDNFISDIDLDIGNFFQIMGNSPLKEAKLVIFTNSHISQSQLDLQGLLLSKLSNLNSHYLLEGPSQFEQVPCDQVRNRVIAKVGDQFIHYPIINPRHFQCKGWDDAVAVYQTINIMKEFEKNDPGCQKDKGSYHCIQSKFADLRERITTDPKIADLALTKRNAAMIYSIDAAINTAPMFPELPSQIFIFTGGMHVLPQQPGSVAAAAIAPLRKYLEENHKYIILTPLLKPVQISEIHQEYPEKAVAALEVGLPKKQRTLPPPGFFNKAPGPTLKVWRKNNYKNEDAATPSFKKEN